MERLGRVDVDGGFSDFKVEREKKRGEQRQVDQFTEIHGRHYREEGGFLGEAWLRKSGTRELAAESLAVLAE